MKHSKLIYTHPKYRADIDGLRALAVMAVVLYHAFPNWMVSGFTGVDIFFVISGYIISVIIFENLLLNTFSFYEFYGRRIRRIFPSLIFVLLIICLIGWISLFGEEYAQLGKYTAGGAGFISNFILMQNVGYFENSAQTKPLLHLWSLAIEEQFYIIWPVIIWCAWKYRVSIPALIFMLMSVSFVINVTGIYQNNIASFYSPITRAWEIMCGCLLAYADACGGLYRRNFDFFGMSITTSLARSVWAWNQKNSKIIPNFSATVGIILLVIGLVRINNTSDYPGLLAFFPVVGSILIISLGSTSWINRSILSNKIVVWFGLISYPLYLWHWPILSFAIILEGELPSRSVRLQAVVLSIILAWLTQKYIEAPLRHAKKNYYIEPVLSILLILVGLYGYITYSYDGFPSRSVAVSAKEILKAKSDWTYESTSLEGNQITNLHFFKGLNNHFALFIGSSHMGQYFPRVKLLYANSRPSLGSIYAARNHCIPMPLTNIISGPDNINCNNYYDAAIKLANDKAINKIIFAANWGNFYNNNQLTPEASLFAADITKLIHEGKSVYIISNPPINPQLDPGAVAKPLRFGMSKHLNDAFIDRDKLENKDLLEQVLMFSKVTGAHVINPYDYLCDINKCPVLKSGEPLYIDHGHIRAKFSETNATFIDKLLTE